MTSNFDSDYLFYALGFMLAFFSFCAICSAIFRVYKVLKVYHQLIKIRNDKHKGK